MNKEKISLAEVIQSEITRVREIQGQYRELDGMPGINVKPAIFMMEATIQQAIKALAEGDAVACMQVYKELRGFKGE